MRTSSTTAPPRYRVTAWLVQITGSRQSTMSLNTHYYRGEALPTWTAQADIDRLLEAGCIEQVA